MTGYIIQPWDFTVVQAVNVTDYDLPLECYSGESGSVTFEGKSKQDYSQYLFRLDVLDTMWKIKEAETGDAQSTKLSVTDQTGILDGAIVKSSFDNSMYSSTIDRPTLFGIIGLNNRNDNTDFDLQSGRFMYPYLRFNNIPNSDYQKWNSFLASVSLTTSDYALYSANSSGTRRFITDVYKLISELSSVGISVKYSIALRRPNQLGSTTLALYVTLGIIENYSTATPVYFKDGHSYLLSESYDGDVCSCFIGIPSSPSTWPPSPVDYVYYLNENMQPIPSTGKDSQINGYTKMETCSNSGDAYSKALAAFGQNQWKHKVEFASDKIFHLNQPVRLMLERGILNTAISKVTIKSKDERYYYTCGDLPQTAAQHIKANSWSYGMRLPHNPYVGQLAFV